MKKFKLLIQIIAILFASSRSVAQDTNQLKWFGEIKSGWQATLNEYPLNSQIKTTLENKSSDSSNGYTVFFMSEIPVHAIAGFNNQKGLQIQLDASYYSMRMYLDNTSASQNDEYLFAVARVISVKTTALIDYSYLYNHCGSNTFHFLGGISASATLPLSAPVEGSAEQAFGIKSFQKNITWSMGLDMVLNIDLSKKIYVSNTFYVMIPFIGNMGTVELENNSNYTVMNPVQITSFSATTGIGFRF